MEEKRTMDLWISEKIGLESEADLTREKLERYQIEKLKETLEYANKNSQFYKDRFRGADIQGFKEMSDIERFPFTTGDDLRAEGKKMLCVSQGDIARIVTLDTSGTTGNPKRVYYTEEDQELTRDFFNRGMRNLVGERDKVLIMLPYERPGSVGDILADGLGRLGARVVPYGLLREEEGGGNRNMSELIKLILDERITSIVGSPTQVAKLALESEKIRHCAYSLNSVLLSVEYVSAQVREDIKKAWDCEIFEHYGMTEMGLGGAVSCIAFEGYHPREADLYFEIIDPETKEKVPDGEYGEVVFTTLTRKGMPFIRYRTGDISRWLTEPCPCGSILKRLDRVGDRKLVKGLFKPK